MTNIEPEYALGTAPTFTNDQIPDIIRSCTFRPKEYSKAVCHFDPNINTVMSISTFKTNHPSRQGCGMFDVLPLEIFQQILLDSDMLSVMRLRHTCYKARNAINSMLEYRDIITHAASVVRALLHSRVASRISVSQFHQLLGSNACIRCKGFGDLVHLPTWQRCCSTCIYHGSFNSNRMAITDVHQHCNSTQLINELPTFIPLSYDDDYHGHVHKPGPISVSSRDILKLYLERANEYMESVSATEPPLHGWTHDRYGSCCEMASYDPRLQRVEHGLSCIGCRDRHDKRPLQERAAVVHGKRPYHPDLYRDRIYSQEMFLDHFPQCLEAQNIWVLSKYGTNDIPSWAKRIRDPSPELSMESWLASISGMNRPIS